MTKTKHLGKRNLDGILQLILPIVLTSIMIFYIVQGNILLSFAFYILLAFLFLGFVPERPLKLQLANDKRGWLP